MSVSIEEVLALLPEMFPGTQQIPLKNIRPNPNNPGPALTEEQIHEMADDLAGRGLQNPIKVRPLPSKPLREGIALHPENPRLRGDGHAWEVGDFNWEILSGELRSRGAERLGWKEIDGYILNPTPGEAVEIAYIDNKVRSRGWFADWKTIENRIKAEPNLTLDQVSQRLSMDSKRVRLAYQCLSLLNLDARGLIPGNSRNSNKGIWGISEAAVTQLAPLGPGSGLKPGVKKAGEDSQVLWPYPPIPEETKALFCRCLKMAIDQELTEAGVKALVAWVQEGHEPETYGSEAKETPKSNPKVAKEVSPEYRHVPVGRTRLPRCWAHMARHAHKIDRKALAMKTTGEAKRIGVRTLSDEEKLADSGHDYEVFDGFLELEAARKLGWPSLDAVIYKIDEREALHRISHSHRHSQVLTWIEIYESVEKNLMDVFEKDPANLAIRIEEDPVLMPKVMSVLNLLNEPARKAIWESNFKCFEGIVDMGGYRFVKSLTLPLKRLEKISKDLAETQKIVEKVVNVAIENEMGEDEIEKLVDWVWDGNEPEEYFVEEA